MDDSVLVSVAPAVGVAIGLSIHFARQRKQSAEVEPRVLAALDEAESLSLPEIVALLGMKDGFYNRGKVVNLLLPLIHARQIQTEEPPGTTMKNRLALTRYRRVRSQP